MNYNKCVYCEKQRPNSTFIHDENGLICLHCQAVKYYDGWDRREVPLTLKEVRDKIYDYGDD